MFATFSNKTKRFSLMKVFFEQGMHKLRFNMSETFSSKTKR